MENLKSMMKDLHHLMLEGHFTDKQATEVTEMMNRVSAMEKETSTPQGDQLVAKHEQELKEMHRRLEIIQQQLKSPE